MIIKFNVHKKNINLIAILKILFVMNLDYIKALALQKMAKTVILFLIKLKMMYAPIFQKIKIIFQDMMMMIKRIEKIKKMMINKVMQ